MADELDALRDHARQMVTALHRPDCLWRPKPWLKAIPRDGCTGCVTEKERRLWKQIADEVQVYLDDARSDDGDGSLFEGEE